MATVQQLIDQVIRRLNEITAATPVHWARSEILVFINDALTELNLIPAEIQTSEVVSANSGANIYALAAGVIAPLTARTSFGYLSKQSVIDMDNELDWELPSAVRMRIKQWAVFGLTSILINPRPLAATNITIDELHAHTPATDAAVNLEIRPEYEPAIQDYAVSRAMFKEGGAELDQMEQYHAAFLDAVQMLSGRNVLRRYPAWDVAPETVFGDDTQDTLALEKAQR